MRTVLVCVRTPLVAHNIAAMAARLGLSAAVRTAASEPEVMLRLAERACDVVLADTGLARPDPAAFVRRVLNRAPAAAVLLIGAEERTVAAAAVAAGARGLVQADGGDLITGVVKTMLLLAAAPRTRRVAGLSNAGDPSNAGGSSNAVGLASAGGPSSAGARAGVDAATAPSGAGGDRDGPGGPGDSAEPGPGGAEPPAMVPVQRGDETATEPPVAPDPRGPGGDSPALSRSPDGRPGGAPGSAGPGATRRGDTSASGVPGRPGTAAGTGGWAGAGRRVAGPAGGTGSLATPGMAAGVPGAMGAPGTAGVRGLPGGGASAGNIARIALTEREMQVLIGMADGKSNAEIGRELFVSEDTVKTHARRLFRKLGARDRAHAVAAGFRAGLVA